MHYSSGLEYIVGNSYSNNLYSNVSYFSINADDNYRFTKKNSTIFERQYPLKTHPSQYKNQQSYSAAYTTMHSFVPDTFLSPSRPKTGFISDISEIKRMVEETFELMMNEKLPNNISISVLPFDDFKVIHSRFGAWNNGILGFSISNRNEVSRELKQRKSKISVDLKTKFSNNKKFLSNNKKTNLGDGFDHFKRLNV